MTIRQTLAAAARRLEAAGVPDSAYDAQAMLAHVLGETDMLRMRVEGWREVSGDAAARYEALIGQREKREPMQYILGEAYFMGHVFHVEPGVLIPRYDTEVLCEEALRRIKDGGRVLDIGTGSGALAISIALGARGCHVTAVDVSDTALAIAAGNAAALGADVRFVKSDCFAALAGERYDLIVSNPPYIDEADMRTLMPEVQREPELALFGGADGLDFYRRISREAPAYLNAGGSVLFEIGWKQKDDVSALVRKHIGEPFALKDYGGNWRVVGAALNR